MLALDAERHNHATNMENMFVHHLERRLLRLKMFSYIFIHRNASVKLQPREAGRQHRAWKAAVVVPIQVRHEIIMIQDLIDFRIDALARRAFAIQALPEQRAANGIQPWEVAGPICAGQEELTSRMSQR